MRWESRWAVWLNGKVHGEHIPFFWTTYISSVEFIQVNPIGCFVCPLGRRSCWEVQICGVTVVCVPTTQFNAQTHHTPSKKKKKQASLRLRTSFVSVSQGPGRSSFNIWAHLTSNTLFPLSTVQNCLSKQRNNTSAKDKDNEKEKQLLFQLKDS